MGNKHPHPLKVESSKQFEHDMKNVGKMTVSILANVSGEAQLAAAIKHPSVGNILMAAAAIGGLVLTVATLGVGGGVVGAAEIGLDLAVESSVLVSAEATAVGAVEMVDVTSGGTYAFVSMEAKAAEFAGLPNAVAISSVGEDGALYFSPVSPVGKTLASGVKGVGRVVAAGNTMNMVKDYQLANKLVRSTIHGVSHVNSVTLFRGIEHIAIVGGESTVSKFIKKVVPGKPNTPIAPQPAPYPGDPAGWQPSDFDQDGSGENYEGPAAFISEGKWGFLTSDLGLPAPTAQDVANMVETQDYLESFALTHGLEVRECML